MNQVATRSGTALTAATPGKEQVFVTIYVQKQLFGMPVERVQDILVPERIANIPLAPPEIAGAVNLRGRIVTVVNVRACLSLPPFPENTERMCVTVEEGHELYSLMVDSVGAVVTLDMAQVEKNPPTLDPRWRGVSSGVVRLDGEIMIVMDIDALLEIAGRGI